MEEPVVSPDDLFASMRNREVYYMPIAQTQHPPATEGDGSGGSVHVIKCKYLLAMNFSSTNWTGSDVSFGAAQPTQFARDNVSLMLKMMQWAILARLNFYVETLYDGVLADATGRVKERGKRVWLPVPETRYHEFAAVVMASLQPEDEEPKGRKRKRSKGAVKASGKYGEDAAMFASYVSHGRISSDKKLLEVLHVRSMCSLEAESRELNFDMLEGHAGGVSGSDGGNAEDAGDTEVVDRNSIFYLLDYRRVFDDEQSQDFYEESRLPDWQRSKSFYYDDEAGMFIIGSAEVYEHSPVIMRMIRPDDGFLAGDADNLRNYLQQTVEVPLEAVRLKICELSEVNGFHRREKYEGLSDKETMALFIDTPHTKAVLRDFAHCAKITAPDPFAPSQAHTFSRQYEYLITPIAAKLYDYFIAERAHALEWIGKGKLDVSELDRVDSELAEAVFRILETKNAPGVPAMYAKINAERGVLKAKMTSNSVVARMARGMYMFDNVAKNDPRIQKMALEDRLFCSYADLFSQQLLATPFQSMVILKGKMYCAVLLRNYFGPQSGICMQGTCDVGKSHCAKALTTMFPQCQIESENDASDKAFVMKRNAMAIIWRDEMNFGGEKAGSKDRDDKATRSAFSTGVLIYNQYKVGKNRGDSDSCKTIVIDSRSFCIATINNELNAALRSRFDVIQTFQEKKEQTGRKKTEKASATQESLHMQAANLQFQFSHTAYAKYWATSAVGGLQAVDMRNFEVFCSLYQSFLVRRGQPALMARDIDKLRNLALGVMVDRVCATWERSPEYEHVCDSPAAYVRYYQIHGGALRMKDVMLASSLARPANCHTVMDTMIIKVLKKMIVVRQGGTTEAVEDATGAYYATTLVRRDCEREMTSVALSMNMDCNPDMIGRAFAKLGQQSIGAAKCIKFEPMVNSNDTKDVLHIRKEMVNTTSVLTDSEAIVLEWLRSVVGGDGHAGVVFATDAASEENILLHKNIRRGMLETPPMCNNVCDDVIKPLHEALGTVQRQTAMFWLMAMNTANGDPLFESCDTFFYRIAALHDAPTVVTEPCLPDGPNAGKHKQKLPMAGAMRVNARALETYSINVNKQATDAQFEFVDLLMEVSGEAKPGDVVFWALSETFDEDTPAAVCHTVRPHGKPITFLNPRRREMASVLDHSLLHEEDDILAESQMTITLDGTSRLTERVMDRACRANTARGYAEASRVFDAKYARHVDDAMETTNAISALS